MNEANYYLAFSVSPVIGPKKFQNLLKIFGSAEKAWSADSEDLKRVGLAKLSFQKFDSFRNTFDVDEYSKKLKKAKVEFVEYGSKFYPEGLKKLSDPPIGLFIKGNKNLLLEENLIGVVGARKITSYGKDVTEKLVSELSSSKTIIVSGMALGVDGVAHKSAIENLGRTIAVLGCGVDCPYPLENEKLYEDILDSNGLVISEYPLGMPANQGTFPARNRIIAALSIAVLITEAAEDSGSLITASNAASQGKKVFAIPGPITSHMSKGSLKLLKEGAVLVACAEDILLELNIKNKKLNIKDKELKLSKEEKKIFDCLKNEERSIDEIAKLTKIEIGKLSIILSGMELLGIIKSNSGRFSAIQI